MKYEDCNIGDIIEYRANCGEYSDCNNDIQKGMQFKIIKKEKYHVQIKITGKSNWLIITKEEYYTWWVNPAGFIKINT